MRLFPEGRIRAGRPRQSVRGSPTPMQIPGRLGQTQMSAAHIRCPEQLALLLAVKCRFWGAEAAAGRVDHEVTVLADKIHHVYACIQYIT